ncbi:hypothetical protein NDU88_010383 [Pleurodeles waltl]|uniref:Uncharacterized protein n=1 Tax=Pleurodeles waltl TaxID=8319 RepID=A0AAV7QU81_PLEWA|nr:hypothetical protein NDU88_010383 [Pleurodeles waltl]
MRGYLRYLTDWRHERVKYELYGYGKVRGAAGRFVDEGREDKQLFLGDPHLFFNDSDQDKNHGKLWAGKRRPEAG